MIENKFRKCFSTIYLALIHFTMFQSYALICLSLYVSGQQESFGKQMNAGAD